MIDGFKREFRCIMTVLVGFAAVFVAFSLNTMARADLIGHGGTVRAVAISPDGTRVLSGSFDYSAILWNFSDQSPVATLDGHEGPVNDVVFSGDGKIAVTAADDGKVRFFSSQTGELIQELKAHTHKAMGLAAAKTQPWIATAGWDRLVKVFTTSGETVFTLKHPAPVNALAFLANDTLLATGGHDGVIRLFRMSDGEIAGVLEGHGLGVTRLLETASGDLVSSGIDGSIRVWNIATRLETALLKQHDGQVYALAELSVDGSILSGGKDGQLLRWDLNTGAVTDAMAAHDRMLWAIATTPDGRFAVTAGLDDAARVWHLETHDRIGLDADAEANTASDLLWQKSEHPGASLFAKCAQCHSLTPDGPRRSGPNLAGLFGRRVGTLDGYAFSNALQESDIVWTERSVFDLFDLGPDVVLPGTKMPVQKVTNADELKLLVDFLKGATVPQPQ